MLDTAINSFLDRAEVKELKLEEQTPWAKLGEKWHYLEKGFPAGQEIEWEMDTLKAVQELLESVADNGSFVWTEEQIVHFTPAESTTPWASIMTKKTDGVWLSVRGPARNFTPDRVTRFSDEAFVDIEEEFESVRMKFQSADRVNSDDLRKFLMDHLNFVNSVEV